MKKHVIKIRMSAELREKLLAQTLKEGKKPAAYIREQLEQPDISDENISLIENIIDEKIKKIGLKVNYKTRIYNTYGAVDVDDELPLLLKDVIELLKEILKIIKEKQPSSSPVIRYEEKRKNTGMSFSADDRLYSIIKNRAQMNRQSVSKCIRECLENARMYTKKDVQVMLARLHNQVYPIQSNAEQICFKYSEMVEKKYVNAVRVVDELLAEMIYLEKKISIDITED